MGHCESNERDVGEMNGRECLGIRRIVLGNRLHLSKQNSHRAGIVPFPCRLLSDSTIPQVMQDVPQDDRRNSLIPRCRVWNKTKHYVYCNKCRGGGECDWGQRRKVERFFCQTKNDLRAFAIFYLSLDMDSVL